MVDGLADVQVARQTHDWMELTQVDTCNKWLGYRLKKSPDLGGWPKTRRLWGDEIIGGTRGGKLVRCGNCKCRLGSRAVRGRSMNHKRGVRLRIGLRLQQIQFSRLQRHRRLWLRTLRFQLNMFHSSDRVFPNTLRKNCGPRSALHIQHLCRCKRHCSLDNEAGGEAESAMKSRRPQELR